MTPFASAAIVLDAEHGSAALEPCFTHITCRVGTNQGTFCLSDRRYRRSVGQMPANDPFGTQPWQTIEAKDRRGILDLRLMLRSDDRGHWIAKIWLANRSAKPLRLGSLVIEATRSGDWHGGRVLKLMVWELEQFSVEMKEGETYGGIYATAANASRVHRSLSQQRTLPRHRFGHSREGWLPLTAVNRRRRRHPSGRKAAQERAGVVFGRRPSVGRVGTTGPLWPAVGTKSISGRRTSPPGAPGIPA